MTIEYQSGEDWIKKTASTYKKDPSGNGGTITYTVYVKANESNTYTLNNVKIHDNFSSGTNTTLLPYINYDENSFQLYEGNKADETKKLEIPENPHKGQKNPYIVNDKKKECKIDFYLGKLKPGEERTLTYQVKISEDIFAMSNQEIKVKNTAAAYSDDTINGGNQKFASATQEKSLGKKVWDRKLQSDPITKEEQINIPEQDKVYNSNMEISPLAVRSFKIPKGSYKYQVVVNEAATKLEEKTPSETNWVDIHDGKQFSFSPEKFGNKKKTGAYLLTYYATPKNVESLTQVSSGNSFSLGGTVIGPGGTSIKLAGVKVSTSMIIEGGNNFKEMGETYTDRKARQR